MESVRSSFVGQCTWKKEREISGIWDGKGTRANTFPWYKRQPLEHEYLSTFKQDPKAHHYTAPWHEVTSDSVSMLLCCWDSGLVSWLALLPSSDMVFGVKLTIIQTGRQEKVSPNPRVILLNGIYVYKKSIGQM